MTMLWVMTPRSSMRTPLSSGPSVMPVAAKKQLSLRTRSSVVSTAVGVVAGRRQRRPLGVVAAPQPALDLAAHRLQRRRRDDTFGRAADAHQHVDTGARPRRGDGAVDVAVGDHPDARSGCRAPPRSARHAAGRSRITTIRSRTDSPFDLAIQRRFCVAVAVMSIAPTALGPTAIFSM